LDVKKKRMNFLGFGGAGDISIDLENADNRKKVDVKIDKTQKTKMLLYTEGEAVKGRVVVSVKDKKIEHNGIKIEFLGQIELYYDRGNYYDFVSLVQELAPMGVISSTSSFNFDFDSAEMPFESYNGLNVRLRYFLRVTVSRRMSDLIQEKEIWVHRFKEPPEINSSIKMEVGIEGCLHIEFEYNKAKYSLKDVIVGKIYFLLVRIKIQRMELSIIKRETTGSGANTYNESETVTKFEIMDGSPVKGECIPVRLFLNGFDLTPSYRDINKKFSVRYFLNLVLVDQDDRRYFKQQEITLWRSAPVAANPNGILSQNSEQKREN